MIALRGIFESKGAELTDEQAQEWHTNWPRLTLEQAERRLKRLRWLSDFVMAAGDKIPLEWQQYLFAELSAGEAYVAQLNGASDDPEASGILESLSADAAAKPGWGMA
jgi:hypothetical protein